MLLPLVPHDFNNILAWKNIGIFWFYCFCSKRRRDLGMKKKQQRCYEREKNLTKLSEEKLIHLTNSSLKYISKFVEMGPNGNRWLIHDDNVQDFHFTVQKRVPHNQTSRYYENKREKYGEEEGKREMKWDDPSEKLSLPKTRRILC